MIRDNQMHSTVRDYVLDYEKARKLIKPALADPRDWKDKDKDPNMKYLLRVRIHTPYNEIA